MTVTRKQIILKDGKAAEQHFQGAVIDENGREIPITSDMIVEACEALESQPDEKSFTQKRSDSESNNRLS